MAGGCMCRAESDGRPIGGPPGIIRPTAGIAPVRVRPGRPIGASRRAGTAPLAPGSPRRPGAPEQDGRRPGPPGPLRSAIGPRVGAETHVVRGGKRSRFVKSRETPRDHRPAGDRRGIPRSVGPGRDGRLVRVRGPGPRLRAERDLPARVSYVDDDLVVAVTDLPRARFVTGFHEHFDGRQPPRLAFREPMPNVEIVSGTIPDSGSALAALKSDILRLYGPFARGSDAKDRHHFALHDEEGPVGFALPDLE